MQIENGEARNLKMILYIITYAVLSAIALLCLKISATKGLGVSYENGGFIIKINIYLIIGLVLYILTFLLSLYIMRTADISFFYPTSIGIVYVLVCVMGIWVLKETVTIQQVVGMTMILMGVIMINVKSFSL